MQYVKILLTSKLNAGRPIFHKIKEMHIYKLPLLFFNSIFVLHNASYISIIPLLAI